ncbi:MAG: ABC transporter permease [Pseudomonadota bacterium]
MAIALSSKEEVSGAPVGAADASVRLKQAAEALVIPLGALLVSAVLFGLFVAALGKSPFELYQLMYKGGFGTWFSWQNTLSRAAPLLLTALCVAIPAQLGLVVIGGEGALVLGGLAAAAVAMLMQGAAPLLVIVVMALSAMAIGAAWIGMVGALRHYRGVNETIASLLLAYIAIALFNHIVEGPLRDPASLNKPATAHIGEANMLGTLPGMDVHVGLAFGVIACIILWVLMARTTFGFAARMTGGNVCAARLQGLPVGRLILICTAIAGACAGLAGMVEVAAVHGRANASLIVGYGYAGILIAFLARHNPLAIIPVAILMGGIDASGGLIQRRMDLPDATVLVLQGIIFIVILLSETLYGRFKLFQPKGVDS